MWETAGRWSSAGRAFALAVVAQTRSSAPRPVGSAMIVDGDTRVFGSVSGGCVEGAVTELSLEAIASGRAATETFGISDDDAMSVGLTCGGIIDVVVCPVGAGSDNAEALARAARLSAHGEPHAIAVFVAGTHLGRLVALGADEPTPAGVAGVSPSLATDLRGELARGRTTTFSYDATGCRVAEAEADGHRILVIPFAPPPPLVIFGAGEFARALSSVGKLLGYRVVLADPRTVFALPERYPDVDEVIVGWPDEVFDRVPIGPGSAVCVLSHDEKLDLPAVTGALASSAGYVGAMGSRRTDERRRRRLREQGVDERSLARLHSPIGLAVGAVTAEEVAISIGAELVRVLRGGTGDSLARVGGSIHAAAAPR